MAYDVNEKLHTCKSCGVVMTYQEILDAKQANLPGLGEEERRKQRRRDYLNWWLSTKKE
ncbi:MAG: hypothetical protein ACE5PO_04560 [Candidatus Bathyarchaeia archaeon]